LPAQGGGEKLTVLTAYRQCKVDYFPYLDDFTARKGEEAVDRERAAEVLTDFLKANNLNVDWKASRARRTKPGQRPGDDVAARRAGKSRAQCWEAPDLRPAPRFS